MQMPDFAVLRRERKFGTHFDQCYKAKEYPFAEIST